MMANQPTSTRLLALERAIEELEKRIRFLEAKLQIEDEDLPLSSLDGEALR